MIPLAQTSDLIAIDSQIQANWQMPIWLWIVVICLVACLAAMAYWTERGRATYGQRIVLAALRTCLVLLAVWMLGGWSWLRYQTQKPELAILIDSSSSMATRDIVSSDSASESSLSRFERAKSILQTVTAGQRRQLQDRYQVHGHSVDESLIAIPAIMDGEALDRIEPSGTQSRLGDGLTQLIQQQAGRGTAAIVFLSDGINTAGSSLGEAERLARTNAIPIFAVSLGRQFTLPDIRLTDLLVAREVFYGDRVNVEVGVFSTGVDASNVVVSLIDQTTGEVLDSVEVEIGVDRPQSIAQLSFVPERPGEFDLSVAADTLPNENEVENNVASTTLFVQDRAVRVLLVQEQPSYEFRFLKHLLERLVEVGETTSFELSSVLQASDAEYVAQDESAVRLVPSNQEQLHNFDVFVLGDFDPELVSRRSQQIIFDAVTQSGAGCVFVLGHGDAVTRLQGWPLGSLLPVQTTAPETTTEFGSFRWQPTPLGMNALPMQLAATPQESGSIWRQLPSFSSLATGVSPKIGAQVLAVAQGSSTQPPLLVTQFAGAGRVAFQASDESYRWTSFGGTDLYHQRYWGQLLRWLSRGKLARNIQRTELLVEPKQARINQVIRFEARLGPGLIDDELPGVLKVAAEKDDRSQQLINLQRSENSRVYVGSSSNLEPGKYRARIVQPVVGTDTTQEFEVTNPPGEQANLETQSATLRSLAESSRGKYYSSDEAEMLFDELPSGTPTRLGTLPPVPIWNHPWVVALFVLLITGEWLLRRQTRML